VIACPLRDPRPGPAVLVRFLTCRTPARPAVPDQQGSTCRCCPATTPARSVSPCGGFPEERLGESGRGGQRERGPPACQRASGGWPGLGVDSRDRPVSTQAVNNAVHSSRSFDPAGRRLDAGPRCRGSPVGSPVDLPGLSVPVISPVDLPVISTRTGSRTCAGGSADRLCPSVFAVPFRSAAPHRKKKTKTDHARFPSSQPLSMITA